MGVVIVLDDDDVAIAIVAAGVTPVERGAADEQREHRCNGARQETIADDAKSHPLGTVAQRGHKRQSVVGSARADRFLYAV